MFNARLFKTAALRNMFCLISQESPDLTVQTLIVLVFLVFRKFLFLYSLFLREIFSL